MKKVVAIIVAVVIAAGIGTGAWYVLKTKNAESTSEEKPESIRTVIDREEYDMNAPEETIPDSDLREGRYYVPRNSYNAGYGPLKIEWGADGYTVKVENFRNNDGYAVFYVNDFGEVTGKFFYETDVDVFGKTKYIKNVVTPRDRYNEKHLLIEWDDTDDSFLLEHDDKGNVTERYRRSETNTYECFSYDKNGNIEKFVVKDFYKMFHEHEGSDDRIIEFKNKLDSFGNVVEQHKTYDGYEDPSYSVYDCFDVSVGQYRFYKNFLETWIVSKEDSTI